VTQTYAAALAYLTVYLAGGHVMSAATSVEPQLAPGGELRPSFVSLRSYVAPDEVVHGAQSTAASKAAPVLIGRDRSEDPLVAQLNELKTLGPGWDGYGAPSPDHEAIRQAVRFVRAVEGMAATLEPTLHADGSVILEMEDGVRGSLQFKGDGSIVYSTDAGQFGRVAFDGFMVPSAIKSALTA
jgi:hypothetical protein